MFLVPNCHLPSIVGSESYHWNLIDLPLPWIQSQVGRCNLPGARTWCLSGCKVECGMGPGGPQSTTAMEKMELMLLDYPDFKTMCKYLECLIAGIYARWFYVQKASQKGVTVACYLGCHNLQLTKARHDDIEPSVCHCIFSLKIHVSITGTVEQCHLCGARQDMIVQTSQ